MRKISKTEEPLELAQWKRKNPKIHRYEDLYKSEEGRAVSTKINEKNIADQFGLCAYCCKRIDASNSMNEHLEPRSKNHQKELDFSNIVASCTTRNQCDDEHKSQDLPLTPLMAECETELRFFLSGDVKGKTASATATINVLQLNNKALKSIRKQAIDGMLFTQGIPPDEFVNLEDDELLAILFYDFKTPRAELLEPFSPILLNILQQYLNAIR